jgi:hypothetical protein
MGTVMVWAFKDEQSMVALPPTSLVRARITLHWASQLVAAVGNSLLPSYADDSQSNLGWMTRHHALVGHVVPGIVPFRIALSLPEFRLLVLDASDRAVAGLGLKDQSLDGALTWLSEQIERVTKSKLKKPLVRRELDLPDHEVGQGKAFQAPPQAELDCLAFWYRAADELLGEVQQSQPEASSVRCWPHHFDVATLMTVEVGSDGSASKTIGIGMSPGDSSYPEPYFYVTPWPYPENASVPAMRVGGHWHREGWFGAVLPGSAVQPGSLRVQLEQIREFLLFSIQVGKRIHA